MINNSKQVLDYLYAGYFDGTTLPTYYKAEGFENFNLTKFVDMTTPPKLTNPIKFYAPKGNSKLREFMLVNPYSYWQLANTLAGEGFDLIASKLNAENNVTSYGLLSSARDSFKAWQQAMEVDLPSEASKYSFLVVTDVSNCYKTIYTHSLAWAVHGRDFIKVGNNRRDYSLVGNRIDVAFQRAMDGQTNGLPVGNAASHFAAELILKDVDEMLSKRMDRLDFRGFRFRDDYRFLVKTKDGAKKIVRELDQILQLHYGMHLNESKTEIFEDIIGNCYRPWKSLVRDNSLLSAIDAIKSSQDIKALVRMYGLDALLLAVYESQKKTSFRLAPALLENIATYLKAEHLRWSDKNKIYASESILEAIVDIKEEAIPQFAKIINTLTNTFAKPSEKQNFVSHVVRKDRLSLLSEQQLCWMYRMLLANGYEYLMSIAHPLIKVLDSDEYDYDYSIFDCNEGDIAQEINPKFTIIDRGLLASAKNKTITSSERNIFYGGSV